MAKKHISVTNKKVLEAMENSTNASRLIEEAVLYYLDSLEKEYITKEEVKEMLFDFMRTIKIENPNYESSDLTNEISDILNIL